MLHSLSTWFDRADSTLEYIRDTSLHPTYIATYIASNGDAAYGFITLKQRSP